MIMNSLHFLFVHIYNLSNKFRRLLLFGYCLDADVPNNAVRKLDLPKNTLFHILLIQKSYIQALIDHRYFMIKNSTVHSSKK